MLQSHDALSALRVSAFEAPSACPWESFTPGTIRFCEDRVCGWVVEPANAFSNAAFLLVGVYLLFRAQRQGRQALLLVGLTSILVGLGSFLFHSSGTLFGEMFDLGAMYLIGALMLTMEVRRFVSPLSLRRLVQCFACISVGSTLLVLSFPKIGIAIFAVQVAVVYACNIYWRYFAATAKKTKVDHNAAYWLGGTFLFALAIWGLDLTGLVCNPTNHVFTGHSVWHILTAVCLIFFYRHQEQFVTPDNAVATADTASSHPSPTTICSRRRQPNDVHNNDNEHSDRDLEESLRQAEWSHRRLL